MVTNISAPSVSVFKQYDTVLQLLQSPYIRSISRPEPQQAGFSQPILSVRNHRFCSSGLKSCQHCQPQSENSISNCSTKNIQSPIGLLNLTKSVFLIGVDCYHSALSIYHFENNKFFSRLLSTIVPWICNPALISPFSTQLLTTDAALLPVIALPSFFDSLNVVFRFRVFSSSEVFSTYPVYHRLNLPVQLGFRPIKRR